MLREENKLGFSFILQNSFEIEKDKDFLYKIIEMREKSKIKSSS